MSFWVLLLLNKGRMMSMCRLTGQWGIISIESRETWGREEIRHHFLTMKPVLKQTYYFIVNKRLSSTWATWTFFFHLKMLFGIWEIWQFLYVLNVRKSVRWSTFHRQCAQAAWCGPDTHLAGPALLGPSGCVTPWDVLVRCAAAQACQPVLTWMLHLNLPSPRKLAETTSQRWSMAKSCVQLLGAVC